MSKSVTLLNGISLMEVEDICCRLENANIQFSIARSDGTKPEAINPRANNVASSITYIANGFSSVGINDVPYRVSVSPDDLEKARIVLPDHLNLCNNEGESGEILNGLCKECGLACQITQGICPACGGQVVARDDEQCAYTLDGLDTSHEDIDFLASWEKNLGGHSFSVLISLTLLIFYSIMCVWLSVTSGLGKTFCTKIFFWLTIVEISVSILLGVFAISCLFLFFTHSHRLFECLPRFFHICGFVRLIDLIIVLVAVSGSGLELAGWFEPAVAGIFWCFFWAWYFRRVFNVHNGGKPLSGTNGT